MAELFGQVGTETPGHGVYRGLYEVRPGTLVWVGGGWARTCTYWALEAQEHTDDVATTAGTVRDLLADAVDRQMVADVPLCSLLSGGLDSSVVSALAAGSLRRLDDGKLATFSVDFTGSVDAFKPDQLRPSHDEPFARAAAEHIGSRHGTITLEAEDLADGAVAAARRARPAGLGRHVRLLRPAVPRDEQAVDGGAVRRGSGRGVRRVPVVPRAGAARRADVPLGRRGSWEPLLRPEVRARVRLGEWAAERYAEAQAEVPRLAGENPWERRIREVLYHGLTRWLPVLLDRKDRLSMAYGLEVRVPFSDHRLVEYVWNVPWSMKEIDGIEKGLLRRAHGLLPGDHLRGARASTRRR